MSLRVECSIARYMRLDALYSGGSAVNTLYRNGWDPDVHDMAAVDAIHAAMVSVMPSVTRALDLGGGESGFATSLHASQGGAIYRNVDMAIEQVEKTSGSGIIEFEAGNLWEYLWEFDGSTGPLTPDWDFTVSCRCAFDDSPRPGDEELLDLIDARSPKGWCFVGRKDRLLNPALQSQLSKILAASTNVTAHSFGADLTGTPFDGILNTEVKDDQLLHAIYIVRDSSTTTAPVINPRWQVVANNRFEISRSRGATKQGIKTQNAASDFKGIQKSPAGGRIANVQVKALGNAPDQSDLTTFTNAINARVAQQG